MKSELWWYPSVTIYASWSCDITKGEKKSFDFFWWVVLCSLFAFIAKLYCHVLNFYLNLKSKNGSSFFPFSKQMRIIVLLCCIWYFEQHACHHLCYFLFVMNACLLGNKTVQWISPWNQSLSLAVSFTPLEWLPKWVNLVAVLYDN